MNDNEIEQLNLKLFIFEYLKNHMSIVVNSRNIKIYLINPLTDERELICDDYQPYDGE